MAAQDLVAVGTDQQYCNEIAAVTLQRFSLNAGALCELPQRHTLRPQEILQHVSQNLAKNNA